MNLYQQINKPALKSWAVLLIIITIYTTTLLPQTSFASTFGNSAYNEQANSDEAFDKEFREGRDLIDKEDWAKAARKFSEIISKYPSNKSTDAALYWLAFCHKKQKQFKETDTALDRLLKEFPNSSWAGDAKVMKMEIALLLGRVYSQDGKAVSSLPSGIYSTALPNNITSENPVNSLSTYSTSIGLSEIYTAASKTTLDREDEIKLAAFQSLLAADPKRAIETMGDILTPTSKASETLKQEVLRALRSFRLSREQGFVFTSGVSSQFLPLLKETLVKSFQKETNIKIRKEIIYALANINDDQSANYLAELYNSENNIEIKKAIINSFSNPAQHLFDVASKLSTNSKNSPKQKIGFDKLMEIVRNEKNIELRRLAFTSLQRFGNWAANDQAINMFSQLYDAETNEEFKILIIRALANIKQNQASMKLLEIAKNDKSDKLKLEAIYALRNSNNPEVLKFLEELIK